MFFYSISYPFIHLAIMRDQRITERVISLNQIFCCVMIILINSMWNKYSKVFYKWYKIFLFTESVSYCILTIGVSINIFSPFVYYIVDTLLFSFISRNIICGTNKLRSTRYKEDAREQYDNTVSIACSAATLIGSCIAAIIKIPISTAFILSWIGITIDNGFYWVIYDIEKRK